MCFPVYVVGKAKGTGGGMGTCYTNNRSQQ